MPRGGKRWERTHQSGMSNRRRARKAPDPVTCTAGDPPVHVKAENELAASLNKLGLSRSVSVLEPPRLLKTKLGGFYYSEVKRCQSAQYRDTIEETYSEFVKSRFVQPDWTNKQPQLGIPTWSNDPMQSKPFATDGKSAPHVSETESHSSVDMRAPAGRPTPGIMQFVQNA